MHENAHLADSNGSLTHAAADCPGLQSALKYTVKLTLPEFNTLQHLSTSALTSFICYEATLIQTWQTDRQSATWNAAT